MHSSTKRPITSFVREIGTALAGDHVAQVTAIRSHDEAGRLVKFRIWGTVKGRVVVITEVDHVWVSWKLEELGFGEAVIAYCARCGVTDPRSYMFDEPTMVA